MTLQKNLNGMMANYLLGEFEFINNHFESSKDYFLQSGKMIKYAKSDDKIPDLVIKLENMKRSSVKNMKSIISKKMNLIDKLIQYQNIFRVKRVAFITGERVRIRSTPVISKRNVISTLNYGDKVIIVKRSDKREKHEQEENYWYQIQLIDNTTGWVFGKYLLFFIY